MKWTAKATRWAGIAAAVVTTACLAASSSSAAVLAELDLANWSTAITRHGGSDVPVNGALGWRATQAGDAKESDGHLRLDLKKLNSDFRQGTIDLVIERRNRHEYEGVFSLNDEGGNEVFFMEIFWDGFNLEGRPELMFGVTEAGAFPFQYLVRDKKSHLKGGWINTIPLPRNVGQGQDVRISITWGRHPGDDGLYVNGQRVPNVRANKAFDMQRAFQKSASMIIGAHYISPRYNKAYTGQLVSVLRSFKLLDQPSVGTARRNVLGIASVSTNKGRVAGFSGKLVAGNKLRVKVEGTARAAASFDVVRLADDRGRINLNWKGYGVYLEDKTFFDEGEVNLKDVRAYRVYVSAEPIVIGDDIKPVETLKVNEQQFTVRDLEPNKPYYVTVVAVTTGKELKTVLGTPVGLPLAAANEGVYEGEFTVGYELQGKAAIVARLSQDGAVSAQSVSEELVFDTTVRVAVKVDSNLLPADESSATDVLVTLTDANGDAVADRQVRFLMATTSEYTGVVGGGELGAISGNALGTENEAETDSFGQVRVRYTAGFAAKTAVIVVRDMVSNDTGAGYVTTFIRAAAQIELFDPANQRIASASGYELTLTSSDEWLTADGRSQANLTATLKYSGRNVKAKVEDVTVSFDVASGSGSIRVVDGTTDRGGRARAVFTAGTKIGLVSITATANIDGVLVSDSVKIELRSDAPAKIVMDVSPARIPADGSSTSDVTVTVTDINDNPSDGVSVEYSVSSGSGRLRNVKEITDKRGTSTAVFQAGRQAGTVTINVTVRSNAPTEEELKLARAAAVEVPDYKFQ